MTHARRRHGGPLFLSAALGLGLMLAASAAPWGLQPIAAAWAQDSGQLHSLTAQVQRLQRELNTLQAQVYRGDVQAPRQVSRQLAQSATDGGGDLAPTQAARLQLRLSQLEAETQELTGRVEETGYRIDRLSQRLDELVADVDRRLQRLEQGAAAPSAAAPGDPAAASGATADLGTTYIPPQGAPAPSGDGSPQVLGTVDPEAVAGVRGQPVETVSPQSSPQATQTVRLPDGTPKEQYDYAFGLLRQANYAEAEQALRAFLERNPEHELAGNAKYWLGETFYVRGDYQQAAVTFAEAYQQYPDNNKAPDNLLKLGLSLSALGSTADACGTHAELLERYPDASAAILQRARQERERLGCS